MLVSRSAESPGRTEDDVVASQQQFVEHRAQFGACQHGAQAVMRPATAESHVRVGLTADVESERRVRRLPRRGWPNAASTRPGRPSGCAGCPFRRRPWRCASNTRRVTPSAAPPRRRSAAPLPARDTARSARVLEERLQSDGQRVLGGVTAGERQHEEENSSSLAGRLNCSPSSPVITAVAKRPPDVVSGVAPLVRGEFHRVPEDRGEEIGSARPLVAPRASSP